MPSAQIKSYAEQFDVPKAKVEQFWKEVKKEYGDDFKTISGTVKKMCKNYNKSKNESSQFQSILDILRG